jgi:alpha-D-xyloside xylohydrolase
VHWGEDCSSSFEGMAETLRGGLSMSASGFAFWSHDMGGFEGTPPEEVFCRWVVGRVGLVLFAREFSNR